MKKAKQLSFIKPSRKFFGGALLHGKRKSMRPLSSKDAIHFVLRSQWAMGQDSFLAMRNRKAIERIINRFALKFGVRIYQQAVNSNHIHLILRITNRILYRSFIKAVSGKIASHVMGEKSFKIFSKSRHKTAAKILSEASVPQSSQTESTQKPKGGDGVQDPHKAFKAMPLLSLTFWQFRPFSRVISWGSDFKTCVKYVKQNILEALGFVPYKARKNYYSRWLDETVSQVSQRIVKNC